jgi:hypothetical protein
MIIKNIWIYDEWIALTQEIAVENFAKLIRDSYQISQTRKTCKNAIK